MSEIVSNASSKALALSKSLEGDDWGSSVMIPDRKDGIKNGC